MSKYFGDVLGGNYTKFDNTGHQTMAGDARPWRDETGDALALQKTGSGVSFNLSDGTVDFATNAQMASDYVIKNVQLNHDRDPTTNIYPHIHFFQAENSVPNFLLQYRWQVNGSTITTSWTSLKCNTLAFSYSSGTIHQIASTAAGIAVPGGTTISDIVQFRICRDTDNDSGEFGAPGNDPYSVTVGILSFDVHIQLNSTGSTDQYGK